MKAPRAMILAAGLGTRLGGLSALRPKPMLPVCGAPLVRWAALWLRSQGIREVVINTHHLGDQIEAELGDGRALGLAIAYSREEGQILGTGGGLRQARPLLDDGRDGPIVVVNGKILLELELAPVLAAAAGAEATLVLRRQTDPGRWGSLRLGPDGAVTELRGERLPHAGGEALMFTGVHVLRPSVLGRVPPEGTQCVIGTAYTELFRAGALRGVVMEGYWWEHSTAPQYLAGVGHVLAGEVRLPFAERPLRWVAPDVALGAGARVDPQVWIGPGAVIGAGASIGPRVQIGARARVAPGVRLRDTVVWDDVEVRADAEGAVLTG